MIHLNEQITLFEPETLQVIVKSHEQHTYFEEKMTTSQPEFYANASLFSQVLCPNKAVVAGPAGRRAPDHFFGRVCFPPCPFFLVLAHFSLCLPLILRFIDAIINNARCACHP